LTCHSFRRGGAAFRVFEALHRLTLTGVCCWARWENAHTLSKYLCDVELTRLNNPMNSLRPKPENGTLPMDFTNIITQVVEEVTSRLQPQGFNADLRPREQHIAVPQSGYALSNGRVRAVDTTDIQLEQQNTATVNHNQVVARGVQLPLFITSLPPVPRGLQDIWYQWYNSVPGTVLRKPLCQYSAMELQFPRDRKNTIWKQYWLRKRLSLEFEKFNTWEAFKQCYRGFTNSIKRCEAEIKRRSNIE
jgi:hypothetical protein